MKFRMKQFVVVFLAMIFGGLCSGMDIVKQFVIAKADLYLVVNKSSMEKVTKVYYFLDQPFSWYASYLEKSLEWTRCLEELKTLLLHNNGCFSESDISKWGKAMQKRTNTAKAAILRALLDILPCVATNNMLSPLRELPCLCSFVAIQQLSREQLKASFLDIYARYEDEINLFFTELLKIRQSESSSYNCCPLSIFHQ